MRARLITSFVPPRVVLFPLLWSMLIGVSALSRYIQRDRI